MSEPASETRPETRLVWDRTTRIFHWVNVLSVLTLFAIGVIILNGSAFGVPREGKILLKTIHVTAGYVFATNLLWRLVWGFIGNPQARWKSILPFGRGFGANLKAYLKGQKAGRRMQYVGHNPLGRIAVTLLLVVLITQAVTGLVLAGTDLYFPPFGAGIAEWVAGAGVDPATLEPYQPERVDEAAYKDMRAFRAPFIQLHVANFYAICTLVVLHVVGVVVSEIKNGGGLVSAMITGRKHFDQKPEDDD